MSQKQHDDEHGYVHVLPVRLLVGVFGALLVLTVLTVLAAKIDLGPANIWLALFIASCKAFLVGAVFMHLWWDKPFNGIILIGSLMFVFLFLGLALMDTAHYQVEMIGGQAPAVSK